MSGSICVLCIQNHRYHAVSFRAEYSQLNLIAISQCIKLLVYHPALVYTKVQRMKFDGILVMYCTFKLNYYIYYICSI